MYFTVGLRIFGENQTFFGCFSGDFQVISGRKLFFERQKTLFKSLITLGFPLFTDYIYSKIDY